MFANVFFLVLVPLRLVPSTVSVFSADDRLQSDLHYIILSITNNYPNKSISYHYHSAFYSVLYYIDITLVYSLKIASFISYCG